jgi:hypothetical protein
MAHQFPRDGTETIFYIHMIHRYIHYQQYHLALVNLQQLDPISLHIDTDETIVFAFAVLNHLEKNQRNPDIQMLLCYYNLQEALQM